MVPKGSRFSTYIYADILENSCVGNRHPVWHWAGSWIVQGIHSLLFSPFLLSFIRHVHLLYCFIPVRLCLRIKHPYINQYLVYIVETTNVSGADHKFALSLRFEPDGKVSPVRGMRGQLCFRSYASRSSMRACPNGACAAWTVNFCPKSKGHFGPYAIQSKKKLTILSA